MLLEMLEVMKYAASQIVISTINGIQALVTAAAYIMQILRAEWAVSGILEKMMVLVFALGIVYIAYKFLWDSAKLIVIFIAVIFLIFFMEGFFF